MTLSPTIAHESFFTRQPKKTHNQKQKQTTKVKCGRASDAGSIKETTTSGPFHIHDIRQHLSVSVIRQASLEQGQNLIGGLAGGAHQKDKAEFFPVNSVQLGQLIEDSL